jgi:hypothetical protein
MATHINNSADLKAALRQGQYSWPRGYPCYFIADDGAALSFEAVRENYILVLRAVREQNNDGWRVIAVDVNWDDEDLTCAHTNKIIPSAYGE